MKIKRGATYLGKDGNKRTVVGVRVEYRPARVTRDEPGVMYRDERGFYGRMYLSNFEKLARRRVNHGR